MSSSRLLEEGFAKHLAKTQKRFGRRKIITLKNYYLLKMSSRHVLRTSSRRLGVQQMLAGKKTILSTLFNIDMKL